MQCVLHLLPCLATHMHAHCSVYLSTHTQDIHWAKTWDKTIAIGVNINSQRIQVYIIKSSIKMYVAQTKDGLVGDTCATDHVSYGKQSKLKDVNKPSMNFSSVCLFTEFWMVSTTTMALKVAAASMVYKIK